MSLFLRDACQEILDDAGLANLHIDIDKHRYMYIAGECGETFVTISGIRLSRSNPGKTEIELAKELLNAFLVKHKVTIDKYLKAKATAAANPPPMTVSGLKNYEVIQPYKTAPYSLTFISENSNLLKVEVTSFGNCNYIVKAVKASSPLFNERLGSLTKDEIKEVRKWVKDCTVFVNAKKELDAAKAALSSCKI